MGLDLIVSKEEADKMRIDLSIVASNVPSARGRIQYARYACR
jgi:hypothetical protein